MGHARFQIEETKLRYDRKSDRGQISNQLNLITNILIKWLQLIHIASLTHIEIARAASSARLLDDYLTTLVPT